MIIYVLVDEATGEELAAHSENGETLHRWRADLESRGFRVELIEKRIP